MPLPRRRRARRPPDPCKVVSKADAEKLAGTKLQDGVLVEGEDPSCTYCGDPNGPTAQVEVFLNDGAKKYLDIDRTSATSSRR